jgi:hypothetical protein
VPDPSIVSVPRAALAQHRGQLAREHGKSPHPPRLESMELFESNFEATLQSLEKSMSS